MYRRLRGLGSGTPPQDLCHCHVGGIMETAGSARVGTRASGNDA